VAVGVGYSGTGTHVSMEPFAVVARLVGMARSEIERLTRRPALTPSGQWDFDEVYQRRWAGLVRLAYVTTGSLAQAEEVVQDVFVQLYQRRSAVDQPEAWLWRAVTSRTISWLRRQRLERGVASTRSVELQAVSAMAVDFLALLSPLPARQRAVLFLRYHEDLTEAEIADVLNCRPGTVKSLTNRALARLRKELTSHA
jgi:RNA polymerase sigma factor (sigma-70 family)